MYVPILCVVAGDQGSRLIGANNGIDTGYDRPE